MLRECTVDADKRWCVRAKALLPTRASGVLPLRVGDFYECRHNKPGHRVDAREVTFDGRMARAGASASLQRHATGASYRYHRGGGGCTRHHKSSGPAEPVRTNVSSLAGVRSLLANSAHHA